MRREFIVDDKGEARCLGEPGLVRSFGSDISREDFTLFAVRNLGFIHATCVNRRWNIRLRPRVVSPWAVAGTMLLLSREGARSGSISCYADSEWRDEIAGPFERLMAKLAAYDRRKLTSGSRRFIARPGQTIRLPDSDPLGRLLKLWELRRADDPVSVAQSCEPLVAGRITLAEAGEGEGFVVRHTGTGYRIYDRSYLDNNSGRRLEDDPDEAYGHWIASSYRSTLETGSAALHEVDAIIRGRRNGLERVCYRRLIVPLSPGGSNRFVLSASVLDSSVDLRAAAD